MGFETSRLPNRFPVIALQNDLAPQADQLHDAASLVEGRTIGNFLVEGD